jgi:hypothetical protein
MASIENKVAFAILSAIRERREEPDLRLRHHDSSPIKPAKLREAQFSDFKEVNELRLRWGLSSDSTQNWNRLWRDNPALLQIQCPPPIGWVLEAGGKVVGYLGNIPLLYHYGDRILTTVTGSGLVAEPAYRSLSVSLNAAFYRQKSVDLYLTTTAIGAVGKIAQAFKSRALPQAEYSSMLFWVLQPHSFAKVVMNKLDLKPTFAGIGGILASLAVRMDKILRRRWPSRNITTLSVKDIGVNEIGDDFQALWINKLKEPPRLLANRSPATLRWHFDFPDDKGLARVFCCYKNGELLGYAIVRHEPPNRVNGLRRSIIADMLAREDDPVVLRSLWIAAYEHAKKAGSHVFEVLGFPPNIRRLSAQWNPYLREYPGCPFYYKATDPNLHNTLSDGMAWYASPFDGDTTLWSFGTAS